MKITVASSAGFCFGVKRAINIALRAAASGKEIRMLGDIVHNEVVVSQLNSAGIRTIKSLSRGRGKTLIIRAHGASEATFEKARRAGYALIDATCPMVKGIHAIARRLERGGRTVIIIGDREHDEVRGIIGQLRRRPVIVSSLSDLSSLRIKNVKRAGVVVQSTQEEPKAFAIVAGLKKMIKDLVFKNTICDPTRIKQKEAKTLPVKNDVVIVVGSKSSANTKRLYQISRSLNRRTYWVNSPGEIRPAWFRAAKSVGITAGASTPDSSIESVARHVRERLLRRPSASSQ